jgi:hypothetical protein
VAGQAVPAVAAALGRPVTVGFGLPQGGGRGLAGQRFATAEAARGGIIGRLGHAAGEVVVEALRRAGHGLTRERMAAARASRDAFETGSLPPLRLAGGPRGAGAETVWLLQVDGEGRVRRGSGVARLN